jgi:glutaredoxin
MSSPEIIIYSKPDCCLCDVAKSKLLQLQRLHQFDLREVNILEDPAAYANFKEEIPVIFINGKKAFKYHLDEERFVRILHSNGRGQEAQDATTD